MKSFNHKCIKICSSVKVSLLYIPNIYELIIILFHLQMSILYVTYTTVCCPTRSSVSHCVNNSLFQCLSQYINIQWLYLIRFRIYFLTNFTISALPCSEYTNAHAQLNTTWLD